MCLPDHQQSDWGEPRLGKATGLSTEASKFPGRTTSIPPCPRGVGGSGGAYSCFACQTVAERHTVVHDPASPTGWSIVQTGAIIDGQLVLASAKGGS